MKNEDIKQESEHEEFLAEAPSNAVPDELEHTKQEKAQDTAISFEDLKDNEEGSEEEDSRRGKDDDDRLSIPDVLPVLPLKETVIYPFAVQPLGVGQERSIRLIDDVMRGDRLVVLVAQKSAETEQAGPEDIFRIGTVDRKSTRLNSSHHIISYTVFCLKKKKTKNTTGCEMCVDVARMNERQDRVVCC